VYSGNTAVRINAPATPIITALSIDGILIPLEMPKTTMPATSDESDLWSLSIGTESKTLLIRGTKNGAMRDADMTAIIASSKITPFALEKTLVIADNTNLMVIVLLRCKLERSCLVRHYHC